MKNSDGSVASFVKGLGWMAGSYAIIKLDKNLYFDARGMWGRSGNEISPFNTYTDTFDTKRWLVYAALIGEFEYKQWRIRPSLKFNYIEERQESYVDSLGVVIPGQQVAQGDLRFGPRISYDHKTENGSTVVPWAQLEGVYSFATSGQFASGSFADEFDGTTATAKAGVDFVSPNGAEFSVSAQVDGLGSDAISYGGRLELSIPLK